MGFKLDGIEQGMQKLTRRFTGRICLPSRHIEHERLQILLGFACQSRQSARVLRRLIQAQIVVAGKLIEAV